LAELRQMRQTLRAELPRQRAPQELATRIGQTIAQEPIPSRRETDRLLLLPNGLAGTAAGGV
jgi:hypothetical protein